MTRQRTVHIQVVFDAGDGRKPDEIRVRLTEAATGRTWERFVLDDSRRLSDEKERRKKRKRLAKIPLLDVLQDYTGIRQPWGTLTGIRPTKLLHREIEAGTPVREAHGRLADMYRIEHGKLDLMQDIVDRQLSALPDLYELKHEVSVYIGIPFCPTKCAYCTFPAYAIRGKQGSVDSFLAGLHYEMEQVGNWLKQNGIGITAVYFGGGTPTSITAEEMDRLYAHMAEVFPDVDRIREITVEAGRPDTITPEKLNVLKKWGIDRISINPQSYIEETLRAIGRHHTVTETIEKFRLARDMGCATSIWTSSSAFRGKA